VEAISQGRKAEKEKNENHEKYEKKQEKMENKAQVTRTLREAEKRLQKTKESGKNHQREYFNNVII
jgi:hypothetical protein